MNNKRAKKLRRAANETAEDYPEVRYTENSRGAIELGGSKRKLYKVAKKVFK